MFSKTLQHLDQPTFDANAGLDSMHRFDGTKVPTGAALSSASSDGSPDDGDPGIFGGKPGETFFCAADV